jgi:hypothetical protein
MLAAIRRLTRSGDFSLCPWAVRYLNVYANVYTSCYALLHEPESG